MNSDWFLLLACVCSAAHLDYNFLFAERSGNLMARLRMDPTTWLGVITAEASAGTPPRTGAD